MDNKDTENYLLLFNVDIYLTNEGEVLIKPHKDTRYEYKEAYKKEKDDKDFSDLSAGSVVKNAKKVVMYIKGGKKDYLYYEPDQNIVVMKAESAVKIAKECKDAEDCFNLYGPPPFPFSGYECKDGECFLI